MSMSGQVTELWSHKRYSLRPTFQWNHVLPQIDETSHVTDTSANLWCCLVRSALTWLCIPLRNFERSSEISDLGWPHQYPKSRFWYFYGFSKCWIRIWWLLLHECHRYWSPIDLRMQWHQNVTSSIWPMTYQGDGAWLFSTVSAKCLKEALSEAELHG